MRQWKKRLKRDLDSVLPEMRENVRSQPIITSVASATENTNVGLFAGLAGFLSKRKKVLIPILSMCLLMAVILPFATGLIPLGGTDNDSLAGVVSVEINPRAVFVTDSEGRIYSVTAMNKEADLILVDDARRSNIIGKSAEDGIKIYTDYAYMLGYIDLASEDAIRVSTCGNEKLLNMAEDALKGFLCDEGSFVVVIGENLSIEGFCSRNEITENYNRVEELINNLAALADLSYERNAGESTDAELTEIYKQEVLLNTLKQFFSKELSSSIDKIEKSIEDIFNIISLNVSIISHKDNPAMLFKDYWSVKSFYTDVDGEFGELIAEMDKAILDYKTEHGRDLSSYEELLELYEDFSNINTEILHSFIGGMEDAEYLESISNIIDALTKTGMDVSEISVLAELPKNAEEYIDKMKKSFIMESDSLIVENTDNYSKELPEVSREDYDKALSNIISKYGSLDEYWNFIKNK